MLQSYFESSSESESEDEELLLSVSVSCRHIRSLSTLFLSFFSLSSRSSNQ